MAESLWGAFKKGFQPKHKRMGVAQAKPNLSKFADKPAEISKKNSAWLAQKRKNSR